MTAALLPLAVHEKAGSSGAGHYTYYVLPSNFLRGVKRFGITFGKSRSRESRTFGSVKAKPNR